MKNIADKIVDLNVNDQLIQDISYKHLLSIVDKKFEHRLGNYEKAFGPIALQAKVLKEWVKRLRVSHHNLLENKSPLQTDLFIFYQIALALDRYNKEKLKLKEFEFRTLLYYPNMLYMLVRIFPRIRSFLQSVIRTVFDDFKRRSSVIKIFTALPNIDEDVIKSDSLYSFLNSGLKSLNPLEINDLPTFYRSVFHNILYFYFKRNKDRAEYLQYDELVLQPTGHTRSRIYRDVLYSLQNERFLQKSPSLQQLAYNFNIFKNIIINNEIQNIYMSAFKDVDVRDNQYKLLRVYYDDLNGNLNEAIRKLPLIYKLLRCVKINTTPSSEWLSKNLIEDAVFEEMFIIFKDFLGDEIVADILRRVANNFVKELFQGEYINLMTLTMIKIKEYSLISQIRQFVRLCLVQSFEIELNS